MGLTDGARKQEVREVYLDFQAPAPSEADLGEAEFSLFSLIAYAVNELNFLHLLLIQQNAVTPADRRFLEFSAFQRFFVVRLLIAKNFETLKLMDKLFKVVEGQGQAVILDRIGEKRKVIEELFNRPERGLAEHIRNKLTFHYDYDHARETLKDRDKLPIATAFLREEDGNCLFYFGEAWVFHQSMKNYIRESKGRDPMVEDEVALANWSIETSKVLREVFAELFFSYFFDRLPGKKYPAKGSFLEYELFQSNSVSVDYQFNLKVRRRRRLNLDEVTRWPRPVRVVAGLLLPPALLHISAALAGPARR